MSDEAVRIVRLEPMLAASFYAFGAEPEAAAWEQLKAWATRRGIWNDLERHPVFGFNNPGPDGDGPYGSTCTVRSPCLEIASSARSDRHHRPARGLSPLPQAENPMWTYVLVTAPLGSGNARTGKTEGSGFRC